MSISKGIQPRFYNLVIISALSSCLLGATAAQPAVDGFPNAVVKQPNTKYVETTTGFSVTVLGGNTDLNRTWPNKNRHQKGKVGNMQGSGREQGAKEDHINYDIFN